MAGYLKSTINFDELQKDIDAAKALSEANRIDAAKLVLADMAKKLKEESEK